MSSPTASSSSVSVPVPAATSTLLPAIPAAAIPIPDPSSSSSNPQHAYPSTTSTAVPLTRNTIPSFPPSAAYAGANTSTNTNTGAASGLKKGSMSMSLSTNVSDLLLSSLLPPNLPKLPPSAASSGYGDRRGHGAPRELSSQREGLSLPLVSNNFRRFVTRVGPIFWLQDRLEEVLFWRKPLWTWAWMMTWAFICFQPRILLLFPSLILILILLHIHEKTTPLPSLLGTFIPPTTATDRIGVPPSSPNPADVIHTTGSGTSGSGGGFSSTTTKDPEGDTISVPVVPPKEVESGVDYFMNLQAIQNLMGLISDAYDYIAPRLASLQSPNPPTSTLSLPITPTHLMLLLLPPTLFLPLIPSQLISYLLLPLGLAPPLLFHPNLTPSIYKLPYHPFIRKIRATTENFMLDDRLSDEIGRKVVGKVEVWENERLDPKIASSSANSGSAPAVLPSGSWGSKHLRPSDRSPWVKVPSEESKWKSTTDGLPSSSSSNADNSMTANAKGEAQEGKDVKDVKMVLALKEGWEWIPGEDWRIDASGLWSDVGVDEEGWVYSDDSWQNPAPTPYTEADSPADKNTTSTSNTMPGLALRRVTRRRRWWRRVYELSEGV
ncbi:hypothetical protein IAT40_004679 [Kwoniella sp. CBS 6097]